MRTTKNRFGVYLQAKSSPVWMFFISSGRAALSSSCSKALSGGRPRFFSRPFLPSRRGVAKYLASVTSDRT